jgi:protein Tex
VVKAGDIVKVKVLEVDLDRKRVALSMRLGDEVARKPAQGEKKASPPRGKARQRLAHQRQQPARPAPVTAMSQAFAKLNEKP